MYAFTPSRTASPSFVDSSIFYRSRRHYYQCSLASSYFSTTLCCFRVPRRNRRRKRNSSFPSPNKTTSPEPNLQTVIDLSQSYSSVNHLLTFSQSKLREFVSSGKDAYRDLKTLVTYDEARNRVVISCRQSTLQFMGCVVVYSLVLGFALRVMGKLGSALWRASASMSNRPLVRRDRSLGGREVVVGRRGNEQGNSATAGKYSSLDSGKPFALAKEPVKVASVKDSKQGKSFEKLPKWWPTSMHRALPIGDKEEGEREANRIIIAIMNNRMVGQDIVEDDIIQLRKICRTSGVQVSIEPVHVRDSLYRTSVDFVINACSREPILSTSVSIYGEDLREFISGLAENIALEKSRAARIVCAAVAARTRHRLLQAWALKIQGKDIEANAELWKLCLLLRTFPPEESSPEMEMVALGLEKRLKVEQREYLMDAFVGICGEHSRQIAREALGLIHYFKGDNVNDTKPHLNLHDAN